MGHSAAEAVVRAGLQLVPFTLTGFSAGVAVSNIGISGIPVELVGKERRQEAMDVVKERYPGLVVVDYTMPNCVNGGLLYMRTQMARRGSSRPAVAG
jgi:4-hydroxy-tetrahydrodipicolinate reductase